MSGQVQFQRLSQKVSDNFDSLFALYKRAEPRQMYFLLCLADIENESEGSTSVGVSAISVTRSEG